MTDAHRPRLARSLAWLWLACVLVVCAHQIVFWRAGAIDSDVLALLPQDTARPEIDAVGARIADLGARQVVLLMSADDAARTRRAAAAFHDVLSQADGGLRPVAAVGEWFASARAFYAPHRNALLTADQRTQLQAADPATLADAALARLYGSVAGAGLTDWRSDPLGLWPAWWIERAAGLDASDPSGNDLVRSEGRDWAVLRYELAASAFRLDGTPHLQDALDRAESAATDAAGAPLRVLRLGVPLHAEAAAVRASSEIGTIGLGSLLAVLVLVWLAFGSARPILLVAASLVIGMAVAVSVTAWVFGQVHLLTLVFGASLVGVAEDYGIHWFACRQGRTVPRWTLWRALLPGLTLALATSALAYLVLGIAPFPGLRQIAVFSAVGLTAAFLTAVLWFPWLDSGSLPATRLSRRIGATLDAWPRYRGGVAGGVAAIVILLVLVAGFARFATHDDLRSLQNSPASLIADQREAMRVLRLPSPAQFFLVTGADAEQVLQREEALTERLRGLVSAGTITGWRAVSDWLPSQQRQLADTTLSRTVEGVVMARVAAALDEPQPPAPATTEPLTLDRWMASDASLPVRALWQPDLGGSPASVVLIDGLGGEHALEALSDAVQALPGVEWIDRTAQYSALLSHYRQQMTVLLLCGHVLVFLLLLWRYGRDAWRVSLPTALASALAVALLALFGQPLQLFNVLGLLVLLGIGIDYGIFLLEHWDDAASWLAVCLGAASTWLAFGLLALSSTPALRAFGLTLLLGIALVWLLSPWLRRSAAAPSSLTPSDRIHAH